MMLVLSADSEERETSRIDVLGTFGIELLIFTAACLLIPGYFNPFLESELGRVVIPGLLVWNTLGLGYIYKTGNSMLKSCFVVLMFIAPCMMVLFLAPPLSCCIKHACVVPIGTSYY